MNESDEWVTVDECARRLNLSERQARRLVARLPEEERTAPGIRPARVRWSPANVRRMSGRVTSPPDILSNGPPDPPDIGADPSHEAAEKSPFVSGDVRPTSDKESGESPAASEALIEQLRAELANLKALLDRTMDGARADAQTHAREIERRDVAEGELRRLLLSDREELRRLRAQLAIPEGPREEAPPDRNAPDSPNPPILSGLAESAKDASSGPTPAKKRGFWRSLWRLIDPWAE